MAVPGWVLGFPSEEPPALSAADTPLVKEKSLAQDHEDVHAWENYFYGKTGGIVLESGALDGLFFSSTFMLQELFGWKAVHVEPSPESYAKLVKNRPNALNINAALCDTFRRVHFVDDGHQAMRGIYEFMAPSFVEKWHSELPISAYDVISCVPLTPVLQRLAVTHIDWWVLDVEGGELAVLQSVDFTRLTIDVITVESDGLNPEKDQQVRELLQAEGYEYQGNERRSDWFVRKQFQPSAKP
jgi:FkbM family methyltransferase